MSLNFKKPSTEHEDLTFMTTLYRLPIKDLLDMDEKLLRTFILKTEAVCHWLRGIQKLAHELEQKGH